MIDLTAEDLVLLARAGPMVPGRPSVPTLFRWALRGIKGVKLESVLVGGRRFTSIKAMQRFVDKLSQHKTKDQGLANESYERRHARVDELLDRTGI